MFENIVGQEKAKKKLSFLLDGYTSTGIMPHLMFVAPKGCGKTTIAKAVAKNLLSRGYTPGKPKRFIEINCSTIKSVRQFIDQIVMPFFMDREVTILFDECSELPRDMTMALLTILNPNKENKNIFCFDDNNFEFDFSRHTFMFATTESQTVFHALMDRCERIDLEEYTYDHLGEIVTSSLKDVPFEKKTLEEISTVLRGNARSAQKMANHIRQYLNLRKKSSFGAEDWGSLSDSIGILPLGLNPIEIQLLKVLEQVKGGCTLTNLAAKLSLTRSCIQRDFETYLQKLNLIEIVIGGRRLTNSGREYLKRLDLRPPTPVEEKKPKIVATWPASVPATMPC
jgi:Holliday junction resolvasome RuvABC ATP-dependent DNA helicase subunit